MHSTDLDLSSFKKAIAQLKGSLIYYKKDKVQQDPHLSLYMRSAAVQAFEFTYELAWKMIKRYLELTQPNPSEMDHLTFPELIRTACEQGLLLSDVSAWKEYRRARGITSHTYDENKAQEVFEIIPNFLKEAEFLLTKLQEEKNHVNKR
jgi:nucleotidyltransferase substrate binding protein (TIGR01987 family)